VTGSTRHDVPLEAGDQPGRRSGEGADSVLPHLQQQVQTGTPAEIPPPPPSPGDSGTPAESD
jgi:hypothetical protein